MEDLNSVILFLIDQTSKVSKKYTQREFDQKNLGITVDQWVLLKIIEEHNGSSQHELALESQRDAASITRTLNLLEKKQLIERKSIPENKRKYEIWLTKTGELFIENNMEMITRHRLKSLEGFSEPEVESLKDMLIRIKNNMSEE